MIQVTKLNPNIDKLIPGNQKYDPLYQEIYEKFSVLGGETSQRIQKHLSDKRFYTGEPAEHWDTSQGLGESYPIVNYSATVINKYADLLTAGEFPALQLVSPSQEEEMKAYGSAAENLIYRILEHNHFAKKLHYGSVNGSMLGDAFFHIYRDPSVAIGGKKGATIVDSISPFFIRVGFAKDNWDDIDYWITESKMSPRSVQDKWGIKVEPGIFTTPTGTGSTTNAPFDSTTVETDKTYVPMVTVLSYHDKEKEVVLVGDQTIFVKKNTGNHGLYHIRNRTAPNEPWGYPDHYNIKEPNRILNQLYGQANEIINSHAAPIIIDKGGVLQGRRLKKRHNTVVTTAPYAPGEGLEYLQWGGNTFPIDKQIDNTTKSIHDLSEMPAAAFGSYQPGTNSGFALQIQMQPTLMRVKIKQNAEWGPAITEMYRYMLKLTLENEKLGIPKEVADWEIKIRWPNPLPREDAREIQNQVALTTNELISKDTARQNLLIEDVVEEEKKIETETIKKAELASQVQQIALQGQMEAQAQIQGQGETALNSPIQPGQASEQAFPEFPEEERATPQNLGLEGGESISPTSTEGVQ